MVIRRLSLLLALAWLAAAVAAAPAHAHAMLMSTTPDRGAVLDSAPRQVVLRFSEAVEVQFGAVRVHDGAGREVQQGAPFHPGRDDNAVAVRLRADLSDGGYTATYRVISADSHPVSGGFVFGVGKEGAGSSLTVAELLDGEDSGPVTSVAFATVRALQFAAIALAVGALAVLILVWLPALATLVVPEPAWHSASGRVRRPLAQAAARRGRHRPAHGAAGAAAPGGHGGRLDVLVEHRRRARGARHALRHRLGPRGLAWLTVLGLGLARRATVPAIRPATVGAAGVAVARPGRRRPRLPCRCCGWCACRRSAVTRACRSRWRCCCPPTCCTSSAASAWIGGIAVLVVALPAATRQLELPDRTRLLIAAFGRFSTLALISVAALLTGGIVQSLLELDAVDDLIDTAYGRAILVKVVLVAVLIAVGAHNRRRTLPALSRAARDGASPGRPGVTLRRALRAEVALGVAALAVTGALAGYPPADTQATGPFTASAALGPARAELTVEPAQAGPNEVHLYFFDRADGTQWQAIKELTAEASLPSRRIAPIELEAAQGRPRPLRDRRRPARTGRRLDAADRRPRLRLR